MKMRLRKKISRMLRQKLRNRVLAEHGVGVLADTWNGRLVVEAGDFAVGRTLLQKGTYDQREIEWLIDCCGGKPELVVVVGTHVGALLIPLARASQHIVGYEPDTKNFSLLQVNLLLNQVINATVTNAAVGAGEGKALFARNSLNTGNSSLTTEAGGNAVSVDVVSLDGTLTQFDQPIDLMVMDVEGHEYHALKGATRTLERVQRLYIEYAPEHLKAHDSTPGALLELLGQHFNHMYVLGEKVDYYNVKDGAKYLASLHGKRHLLVNVLFTKDLLPERAIARTY
jgi:FkbM family methyltransferase